MHYRSFCNFICVKLNLNIQGMVHTYFICIFLPCADCTFRVKKFYSITASASKFSPLSRGTSQSCTFPHVSPQKEPISSVPAGKKQLLLVSVPLWICAVMVLMEQ